VKLKKNEVAKPSATIQISNKITLFQRRAWNILLKNAFFDLKDLNNRQFTIPFRYLCEQLGYKHTDKKYHEVDDILYKLVDYSVRWNLLGKDGKERKGAASLLAGFEIVDGICIYDYSVLLQEKLANPQVYARINLTIQNRFNSKHSLALYELFVDYKGVGQTPWISIHDFRELMGLEDGKYTRFKDLKYDVINKALKEINKESDLAVTLETQKRSRRVVAVKFLIGDKPNYQEFLDLPSSPSNEEIQEIENISSVNNGLLERLVYLGIPESRARQELQKDENRVRMALQAAEAYIEKAGGTIKNTPAVVNKALSEGWGQKSKIEIEDEEKKKAIAEKAKKLMEEKLAEEDKKEKVIKYESTLKEEAFGLYSSLSATKRKEIYDKIFSKAGGMEKKLMNDQKEKSMMFQIKLAKELNPRLPPEFHSFESWEENQKAAST